MLRRGRKDSVSGGPGRVARTARPLVPIDRCHGTPTARPFLDAAVARRPDLLGPLMAKVGAVGERSDIIHALAAEPDAAVALQRWAEQEPASAWAIAARGASLVNEGFRIRGTTSSDAVPRARWNEFWSVLRSAERELLRATRLDPSFSVPWRWMLRSGTGLEVSSDELRLRYEQMLRRGQPTLDASMQLLLGLSARWCGTHEEMFAFAQEVAATAAPGSTLHVLPVVAHIERGRAEDRRITRYVSSVEAEIRIAADRSIDHPAFIDEGYDGALARNVMAFALAMCGDKHAYERERAKIGDRLTSFPWDCRGDPTSVYADPLPRHRRRE